MDESGFKNGYYKVGDEIFESKISAIYRANQIKGRWSWNFHDTLMSSFDWTVEPQTSVTEFYKIRAQQIREKYDYVIVFCSGGADSTNCLYSFLDNGYHVDEVIAGAPMSGLKDWKFSNDNKYAENTISETKFAQIPLLQKISTNYPKTKVTLHDYFLDMQAYKTDEWLFKSGDYIHPTFAARYNLERDEYRYLKDIADSGKKIALVYGIDKPYLAYNNGNFYSLFRDTLVCNGFQSIDHPNVEVELFYYSPELIPMLIKQAHMVARWICLPENKIFKDHAVVKTEANWEATRRFVGIYERAIVPLIYPDIEQDIFQCLKPRSAFMGEHDAWFPVLHGESRLRELMVSDYKNFIKGIDKRFFRVDFADNILGFNFGRKYYRIGNETDFMPGITL